jgi:hypothetical protein
MSRLAFPLGWNNPDLLRSAADRVLAQADRMDNPLPKAEIILRALGLRDVTGAWEAKHTESAAAALEEIVAHGDPVQIASARVQFAYFQLRNSQYRTAIIALEKNLPIVLEHDAVDTIRAEWALGWGLLHFGEWGRMQSVVVAASTHARKNGNNRVEAMFQAQLAWLHVECGAFQSAHTLCASALELARNPERGVGVVMPHVVMAMASLGLNDAEGAVECAQRALAADIATETFWRTLAVNTIVQAHLLKGDVGEAQANGRLLLHLSAKMRDLTWRAAVLSTCARVNAATGHQRTAKQYSETALQLVSGGNLPLAEWRVESIAAEIAHSFGTDPDAERYAAHLLNKSQECRERLFNSLAVRDPLRLSAGFGNRSSQE